VSIGAWPVWFLACCLLIALVCVFSGLLRVLRAAAAVKKRARAIAPDALILRIHAAEDAGERLRGDALVAESLLQRATDAANRIAASLRELRRIFALKP
jgi:hypothetical protein